MLEIEADTGDIAQKVLTFFLTTKVFRNLIGERQIGPHTKLLEEGILDSIGVFDLIGFLEAQFPVRIASQDIVEANFQNLVSIEALVRIKLKGTK